MKCLDTDLLIETLRQQERREKKVEFLDQDGRQATPTIAHRTVLRGVQVEDGRGECERIS